jgi:hypothetical protein
MKTNLLLFASLLITNILLGQLQPPLNTNEQRHLDINQVDALILGRNNKFWDVLGNSKPYYRVPKNSLINGTGASCLWIGGLDGGGQTKMAANTNFNFGTDFFSGPLQLNYGYIYQGSGYQKIWKVSCSDIQQFKLAYANGSVTANTYNIPQDMIDYPGIGPVGCMQSMAPFYDNNQDGLYNVLDGDYPIIRGHQQVMSIYNDNGDLHTESKGLPIGVEVHEYNYAYNDPNAPDSMQAINYTTFHRYEIYNRSSFLVNNAYIGIWADANLGGNDDDYIGSDTINNFMYVYNADNFDGGNNGGLGYGNKIPVVSYAMLESNCSFCVGDGIDNNRNGIVDEPNENLTIDKMLYSNVTSNTVSASTTEPTAASNFYGYMNGFWKDNTPYTYGGNAYGGTIPTNYVYTGNPQTQMGWTEANSSTIAGRRRLVMTTGPITLKPGQKYEFGYAVVYSRDSTVTNTITKFNTTVQRDVKNMRLYDKLNSNSCSSSLINIGLEEQSLLDTKVEVYPNPANNKLNLQFSKPLAKVVVCIKDVLGKNLKSQELNNVQKIQLEVSELHAGIYFITIESEGKMIVKKWMKA